MKSIPFFGGMGRGNGLILILLVPLLFFTCKNDDGLDADVDTDGDGVLDRVEIEEGTQKNNACDPPRTSGYTGFNADNPIWSGADCDGDGVLNSEEVANGTDPYLDEITDTDGDGSTDAQEKANGTDKEDPCDPVQLFGYTDYETSNGVWANADCDGDGVTNGDEDSAGTDPYLDEITDTDGDGITDIQEKSNATDANNPCDPVQPSGYTGYVASNEVWANADCDGDGTTNGDEDTGGTNPYLDEITDADGDGVSDYQEELDGTDPQDSCDPAQEGGYAGYDATNETWSAADCDGDLASNGDEILAGTDPYVDDTVYPVAEFLPKLSDLKVFKGDLFSLELYPTSLRYELTTPLFTDYSYKLRTIALPEGAQMSYTGEGLFDFPDNTIFTKTFYYYNDERNPSLGKKIIETRVLIKQNGEWQMGNYLWNNEQTDAFLNETGVNHYVNVSWVQMDGSSRTINYEVPNMVNCNQCHKIGNTTPIGPKARALNVVSNGKNQLQRFIDKGWLTGAPSISQIPVLPDWDDLNYTLEERARAYMDINCAHCHQPNGLHSSSSSGRPDLRYEVPFADSNIYESRFDIDDRVISDFPNYSMPYVGTTIPHDEGVQLIQDYIDTLD